MSYDKYRESIKQTNEARRIATKTLIANHRQEFDEIYFAEATRLGLNPVKIANKLRKKDEETSEELSTTQN